MHEITDEERLLTIELIKCWLSNKMNNYTFGLLKNKAEMVSTEEIYKRVNQIFSVEDLRFITDESKSRESQVARLDQIIKIIKEKKE